jgi:hypothetical protein
VIAEDVKMGEMMMYEETCLKKTPVQAILSIQVTMNTQNLPIYSCSMWNFPDKTPVKATLS